MDRYMNCEAVNVSVFGRVNFEPFVENVIVDIPFLLRVYEEGKKTNESILLQTRLATGSASFENIAEAINRTLIKTGSELQKVGLINVASMKFREEPQVLIRRAPGDETIRYSFLILLAMYSLLNSLRRLVNNKKIPHFSRHLL
jgi:hypothetical protein